MSKVEDRKAFIEGLTGEQAKRILVEVDLMLCSELYQLVRCEEGEWPDDIPLDLHTADVLEKHVLRDLWERILDE